MPKRRKTDQIMPKLFFALIGATCFTIIGALFPSVMQKYFPDNEQYYYFSENPVKVNKKIYVPCDAVVGSVKRVSKVNTEGIFYRDLVLYKKTNEGVETTDVYNAKSVNVIVEGEAQSNLVLTLPCELSDGTYYWRGVVVYKVKGSERTYYYETERFDILNSKDLPAENIKK